MRCGASGINRLFAVTPVIVAAMLLLSGCGVFEGEDDIVAETQFTGAVAADEPTSALIARQVLAEGGAAADAAVALYFAQAVTQPSMATLGGGGVCLVFAPGPPGEPGTIETLEFYPQASRRDPQGIRRPSAVPGNVRGFFALHARYGRARIERLLAPAEKLARFGVSVSRAFANDLQVNAGFVLQDPEARLVFSGANGAPLAEGDRLVQQNLAAVMSVLRTRGPADFYTGRLATVLVQSVNASGGTLTLEELRDFRPQWTQPLRVEAGDQVLMTPPPPATGGTVSAQVVATLLDYADFDDIEPEVRPHAYVEAVKDAFLARREWTAGPAFDPAAVFGKIALQQLADKIDLGLHTPLPQNIEGVRENPAGTSFVVVDAVGQTVGCTVTPNNPFGVGLMARGTGILLAAAPDIPNATDNSLRPLGPVFAIDEENGRLHLALAGSGGVAYPSAAAWVMIGLLGDDELDLRRAMEVPRLHHSGAPDLVYYEGRLPEAVAQRLAIMGHDTRVFPNPKAAHPGRINAVFCRRGYPRSNPQCAAASDERGSGVAFITSTVEE